MSFDSRNRSRDAYMKFILCIGRGDVAVSGETADAFAANYKSFVEQVKAALPDTKFMYVVSRHTCH